MREFCCKIIKVDNGFVLEKEYVEDHLPVCTEVFQDDDTDAQNDFECEIVPLRAAFYSVMDFFEMHNCKHYRKALDISIIDREDFPVKCALEELKKENEQLKYENVLLIEKLKIRQQQFLENLKSIDTEETIDEIIEDARIRNVININANLKGFNFEEEDKDKTNE